MITTTTTTAGITKSCTTNPADGGSTLGRSGSVAGSPFVALPLGVEKRVARLVVHESAGSSSERFGLVAVRLETGVQRDQDRLTVAIALFRDPL